MKSLPDSHEFWEYIDPTRASYYTKNREHAYLANAATTTFIDYYDDYQINMLAELNGDKEAKDKNHQLTVVHQYVNSGYPGGVLWYYGGYCGSTRGYYGVDGYYGYCGTMEGTTVVPVGTTVL
jgi:hypothetical protein